MSKQLPPGIAQIELWTKNDEYDNAVYRLAKHLDEKVARIHVKH